MALCGTERGWLFRVGGYTTQVYRYDIYLGGGNSNMFLSFTQKLGEDFKFDDHIIFFKGVETTN